MSWQYRVVKEIVTCAGHPDDVSYALVEFHTDNSHTAAQTVQTWASHYTDPSEQHAIDGLRWQLMEMLKALDRPVVDGGTREHIPPKL